MAEDVHSANAESRLAGFEFGWAKSREMSSTRLSHHLLPISRASRVMSKTRLQRTVHTLSSAKAWEFGAASFLVIDRKKMEMLRHMLELSTASGKNSFGFRRNRSLFRWSDRTVACVTGSRSVG